MENETIVAIVEIAKRAISNARASNVDRLATWYCDLLEELGAEAAAEEVYQHYLVCA